MYVGGGGGRGDPCSPLTPGRCAYGSRPGRQRSALVAACGGIRTAGGRLGPGHSRGRRIRWHDQPYTENGAWRRMVHRFGSPAWFAVAGGTGGTGAALAAVAGCRYGVHGRGGIPVGRASRMGTLAARGSHTVV